MPLVFSLENETLPDVYALSEVVYSVSLRAVEQSSLC